MSEPYWVALAGGGVDYKGDWASATAYKSGDVVRWNGVEFLAVNPSTGSIPPLAPSAAGVELAYAEASSVATITATAAASAQTILTAPPVTVDGATPIIVEFNAPYVQPAQILNASCYTVLYEDGVQRGHFTVNGTPAAGATTTPAAGQRRFTPTAGTHVYTVRSFRTLGDATIGAGLSGVDQYVPMFIRVSTSQPIRMGVAIPPTYGTSLPSSPLDGQEAVLVDSLTNPTYQWRFRYNAGSSSAYKWEFTGGAPKWAGLFGGSASSVAISAVNAWVPLDPIVTAPRAGDYWVTGRVSISRYAGTDVNNIFVGIGSNTASIIRVHNGYSQDAYCQAKLTGLAVGANCYVAAYCDTTAGINTYDGSVSIIPVRVA